MDDSLPKNWVVDVGERGLLQLAPRAWLETGFWEAYDDDDASAARSVAAELEILLEERPP